MRGRREPTKIVVVHRIGLTDSAAGCFRGLARTIKTILIFLLVFTAIGLFLVYKSIAIMVALLLSVLESMGAAISFIAPYLLGTLIIILLVTCVYGVSRLPQRFWDRAMGVFGPVAIAWGIVSIPISMRCEQLGPGIHDIYGLSINCTGVEGSPVVLISLVVLVIGLGTTAISYLSLRGHKLSNQRLLKFIRDEDAMMALLVALMLTVLPFAIGCPSEKIIQKSWREAVNQCPRSQFLFVMALLMFAGAIALLEMDEESKTVIKESIGYVSGAVGLFMPLIAVPLMNYGYYLLPDEIVGYSGLGVLALGLLASLIALLNASSEARYLILRQSIAGLLLNGELLIMFAPLLRHDLAL